MPPLDLRVPIAPIRRVAVIDDQRVQRPAVTSSAARTPNAPGGSDVNSDPVKGFGVTFATMFKPVVTEDYPSTPTSRPPLSRASSAEPDPDGLEKCVGCELCAWACPADAIFVEGADNTEEARFSPGAVREELPDQLPALIGCGLCIEACPTRSLTMTNEYELADDNRQRLIYTKDMLLAPLLPGMEQPPHPMRLGDEHDYYARGPELLRQAQNPGSATAAS